MVIAPHKPNHVIAISDRQLRGGDFAKLAALPGFFKWQEDRTCVIRATGANIAYILEQWPDAQWLGSTEEIRDAYLAEKELAGATALKKAETSERYSDHGYKYKRLPMKHQRKAFALSRDKVAFGFFMEQGTGKTKVTLDTACWLWQKEKIDALIVVAWPNGVHRNWVEYEIPLDVSAPYVAEYWSSNHKAKHRQEAYEKFLAAPKGRLKIFCFNVEAFVSPAARAFILKLLEKWRCLLVIDQSASIKNPRAKRTRFLIDKTSKLAPFRRILDGAPVAEEAAELYSQFKFLDPWIIGHDTWTSFKAEFCKVGYFNEIVGYRNMDKLRSLIDGYSFRVRSDDCLDLPPRIYKPWMFDLAANEQRIFDELKVEDIATFGGILDKESDRMMTLEEHNALIKNMRLQQISSGWFPKDGEVRQIEKHLPSRMDALQDLLKAIGKEKALIFARFRADLELLQELLGKTAVSYHGGIKDDDRERAKRMFMRNPSTLYFLGQPRSAGFGHTLTEAKHIIFYSNDHSLRLREECEKRAHRQGLKHKLIVWDLIARKTQDAKIIRTFRAKKELANQILKDPDNFFLKYE
jgi:hypothetical protein